MFKNLTKKQLIIKIVCFVVMAVITVALIVGNVLAFSNANTVTAFLSGTGENFGGATESLAAADELCVQIEEESIVLLRNEQVEGKPALPLDKSVNKVNVFGYGATDTGFIMNGVGSGSSTINEIKKLTLLDALKGTVRTFDVPEFEKYGHYVESGNDAGKFIVDDESGLNAAKESVAAEWAKDETFVTYEPNEEIINIYTDNAKGDNYRPAATTLAINDSSGKAYRLAEPDISLFDRGVMDRAKEYSDVAIFVISREGGENIGEIPKTQQYGGSKNNNKTYLDATDEEIAMLKLLDENFGTVIVLLNTTNTMHLGFLEECNVDACLYIGLPGQSGARAIPEVLSGKVNPSGKFTDIVTSSSAVAKSYDPTYANNEASGYIAYTEDIYYGYKWYETADKEGYFAAKGTSYNEVVTYPFGHGLSYTTFDEEITEVSYVNNSGTKVVLTDGASLDAVPVGAEITVSVKVTNTGNVAGKDVVELYYTPPYDKENAKIEKAEINLLSFKKTGVIEPGADNYHTVDLTFTLYDMASYDCYDKNGNDFKGYELEAGNYDIKVMSDSHNEIDEISFKITGSGIYIENDPVTDKTVSNHFTDAAAGTAYAGVGSDGAEAGVSQKWLSRADFAGTFPSTRTANGNETIISNAANLINNDPYSNIETNISMIAPATDAGKYLWESSEGGKASVDQLKGQSGDTGLKRNEDLMRTLANADFDSDIWAEFLDQMSVTEMKQLVEWGGFRRIATASVGLRQLYDYDGPAGFNTTSRSGSTTGQWTAFQSEALMGCSWNEKLMFSLGRSMGAEANDTTVHGWYAPGVNLHRSNYNARNYEYYSEDGVLSGKLAVQVIAGAKTNGLACYLKHFACSEEGPNPGRVTTWITEQNLRENYLRPFEISVKGIDVELNVYNDDDTINTDKSSVIHVGANAIMTAFNRVGASWAGANYSLNVSVLREEWGFKGTVITDYATNSQTAQAQGWNGGAYGHMNVRQGIRGGNDLWLEPEDANFSLNINTSDAVDVYCSRVASQHILYTVCDTITCYNDVKVSGAQLDRFQTELADKFKNTTGWWQPVLITVDVLVVLGFTVWALFLTGVAQKLIAMMKKKPATATATAAGGYAEGGAVDAVQPEEATQTETPAEETPEESNPETDGTDEN